MKKSIIAFAALAFTVLLSSCSKNEVIDSNNGLTPLKFHVTMGKTTRANAGEISVLTGKAIAVYVRNADGTDAEVTGVDASQNQAPYSVFYMVWSGDNYPGTEQDHPGTAATYADAALSTQIDIYAPTDGSDVYFVAFANSDDSVSPSLDFTFNGTTSSLSMDSYDNTTQSELVYALSGAVNINTTDIRFPFYHIISQLLFIAEQDDLGFQDIKITGLTLHIPTKCSGGWSSSTGFGTYVSGDFGDYTLGDMTTTLNNEFSATAADVNGDSKNDEFASLFVLPYTFTGSNDSYLAVDYEIYDVADSSTPVTSNTKTLYFQGLTHNSGAGNWDVAKRYYYTFKPAELTPFGSRVVEVSITQAVWEDQDSADIEPNI